MKYPDGTARSLSLSPGYVDLEAKHNTCCCYVIMQNQTINANAQHVFNTTCSSTYANVPASAYVAELLALDSAI